MKTYEELSELEGYATAPGVDHGIFQDPVIASRARQDIPALCQEIRELRAKNRRLEVLAKVCRATLRGLKPKVWLMGEPKRVYVELGELDQIRVVLEMIDVEESS